MTPVLPGSLASVRAGAILRDWHGLAEVLVETRWFGAIVLDVDCEGWALVWRPGVSKPYSVPTCNVRLPMDRDAVRDHCSRWLARHHGLTCGATAPRFIRGTEYEGMAAWFLRGAEDTEPMCLHDSDGFPVAYPRLVRVPGIAVIVDPASALALACMAAGGGG